MYYFFSHFKISSFDEVVSEAVEEELSGAEVMELFDKKLDFLLYERLYNFNSLPEILEGTLIKRCENNGGNDICSSLLASIHDSSTVDIYVKFQNSNYF